MLPIERLLDELERFDPGDEGALSLYLRTDPSREVGRNLSAQLHDALRTLLPSTSGRDDAAALEVAVAEAADALQRLSPPPRAVALFVCPPRRLRVVVPLRRAVTPAARWERRLYLKPLLAELDEHERTLVVAVDKSRARVFQVRMGEIEELTAFEDEVPGHQRSGHALQHAYQGPQHGSVRMGYDAPTIERHHEWHVRRHIDRTIDALRQADRPGRVDRIMLAGPVEAVSELVPLLPLGQRHRLAGRLNIPLTATPAEVLDAVLAAEAAIERGREAELIDELVESPALTRFGVTAVAEAVTDAQVHLLVHAVDVAITGYECVACGWLVPGEPAPETCPRCDGAMRHAGDLVDCMIDRVLKRGGRIEEVRGRAAERLRRYDGVAAQLRYEPGAPGVIPRAAARPAPEAGA